MTVCKSIGCTYPSHPHRDFCAYCIRQQDLKQVVAAVTIAQEIPLPPLITESDPTGLSAHVPGAKLDAGKPRPGLVLGGFARALLAVTRIGTYGAVKYTDNGWMEVQNGVDRYDDAKLRHWLYEKCGVECDADTQEMHAAHEAWNSLARLDLLIRKREAVTQ